MSAEAERSEDKQTINSGESAATTMADSAPARTTREKLVEVSELVVDHVLALLKNSSPGTLNAFAIKTCLQLLKDAGLSPTQADEEREKAKRAAAMSVSFGSDDAPPPPPPSAAAEGSVPRLGGASSLPSSLSYIFEDDFAFPDDPTVPDHLRYPDAGRRRRDSNGDDGDGRGAQKGGASDGRS